MRVINDNIIHLKTLIKSIFFLLLITLFAGNSIALANDETKTEEKSEKFNAGELIIDHISDSHDWHIAGDLHLPLPIILYIEGSGLKVFSSSNLEHGKAVYGGLTLKENHIVAVDSNGKVDEEATAKIWDFSITKNTASILFIAFLMCWIFISVAKAYTRRKDLAPKGMQSLVEPLILFVRDDVAIQIGRAHV